MNEMYVKVISTLFAILLAAIGIIWSNSQAQINRSVEQIEELNKNLQVVQGHLAVVDSKLGLIEYRLSMIDSKIDDSPRKK